MADNIKNMHYDFKQKLGRVDTNKYVGLQVPQIDWRLNEGLNLYILLVAEPRIKNQLGVETTQRTIDDISVLVKNDIPLSLTANDDHVLAVLPNDYMYYLSTSKLLASKGACIKQKIETTVIRHDSRANDREFYKSSFDWRECNIRFFNQGIKIFNTDFIVDKFLLDYIKVHPFIHNAEDFTPGGYKLPDGTLLTGVENCQLPGYMLSEIVDLAVLLTTGDLELPLAYQFKQNKLGVTQLIAN